MQTDWHQFGIKCRGLFEKGYITVTAEFCPELEQVVVDCIDKAMYLGLKKVTLIIDSKGGMTSSYEGILGAINYSRWYSQIEYTGLVRNYAGSNAFLLLQQCDWRIAASKYAKLLFHWGTGGYSNTHLSEIIEGDNRSTKEVEDSCKDVMEDVHERTGTPNEVLKAHALRNHYIYADEAMKLNWVDEILNPRLGVKKSKRNKLNSHHIEVIKMTG